MLLSFGFQYSTRSIYFSRLVKMCAAKAEHHVSSRMPQHCRQQAQDDDHRYIRQVQVVCRNEEVFSHMFLYFHEKGLKQSVGYCPWHHFIMNISTDFFMYHLLLCSQSFSLEASSSPRSIITFNFSHQLEAMRVHITIGSRHLNLLLWSNVLQEHSQPRGDCEKFCPLESPVYFKQNS